MKKLNNKTIIVTLPYSVAIAVTHELWLELQDCKLYTYEGWGEQKRYKEEVDKYIETEIVLDSKLVSPTVQELDIKEILAENNRLSRIIEILEKEKVASPSKDIEVFLQ